LVLVAIIVSWFATLAKWHSTSVSVDMSQGVPVYRVEADDSRGQRVLEGFSLFCFVLAGVMSAVNSRRLQIPRLVAFLLATMLMDCVYWCLVTYAPSEYWPLLIGSTSPFLFVICLGVFAGFDPTLWHKLRPVAIAIAFGSMILGIYYTINYTVKGIFEGSNPTIEHLQIAFWFGMLCLTLRKSSSWLGCLPGLLPIASAIPMAVMASSRSFIILAILGLLTGLMIPLQRGRRISVAKMIALGFFTVIALAIGLWVLILVAPDRIQTLNDRLADDSRSGQYEEFFQQVPITSLILGGGPKATYTMRNVADYDYFDNQFLFILFKFGIPVLLGYCAIVIWPGLRLLIKTRRKHHRLLAIVIVFWTLAGLGLSVFHNISVTPQNLVIVLLAGWCWSALATREKGPLTRKPEHTGLKRPTKTIAGAKFRFSH
jgi:hypothetical protein